MDIAGSCRIWLGQPSHFVDGVQRVCPRVVESRWLCATPNPHHISGLDSQGWRGWWLIWCCLFGDRCQLRGMKEPTESFSHTVFFTIAFTHTNGLLELYMVTCMSTASCFPHALAREIVYLISNVFRTHLWCQKILKILKSSAIQLSKYSVINLACWQKERGSGL